MRPTNTVSVLGVLSYTGPILSGRHSNVYGIDMPSRVELVAYGRDNDEIARQLGADLVIYQTLPDLIHSVQQFNTELRRFDCSVFDGIYVTGHVDEKYLGNLEKLRNDNAKLKQISNMNGIANVNGTNGLTGANSNQEVIEAVEMDPGCSGPMNGADDTVGLFNSYSGTSSELDRNQVIGS